MPPTTPADAVAWQVWLMLSNGMGSLDWAGLPMVTDLLGVPDEDIEMLIDRLLVIKLHRPPGEKG